MPSGRRRRAPGARGRTNGARSGAPTTARRRAGARPRHRPGVACQGAASTVENTSRLSTTAVRHRPAKLLAFHGPKRCLRKVRTGGHVPPRLRLSMRRSCACAPLTSSSWPPGGMKGPSHKFVCLDEFIRNAAPGRASRRPRAPAPRPARRVTRHAPRHRDRRARGT